MRLRLKARKHATAILADGTATGTVVVNTGVIDGRVKVKAGPDARFENSGWLGVSRAGSGTTHVISGLFAQTSAGTLALRIGGGGNDRLNVLGTARLDGTLVAAFQPRDLEKIYTILTATDGRTGKFDRFTPIGLPEFVSTSLRYTDTRVTLGLDAEMAEVAGLTGNQRAVGGALDRAFNTGGGIPDGLNAALFNVSEARLPAALDALSGEIYASEHSVLINEGLLARESLLGHLRQVPSDAPPGPEAEGGPDPALWAQGLGAWGNIDGGDTASDVSGNFGGVIGGADFAVGETWTAGLAFGYAQSNGDVDALSSSADIETDLVAGYAGTSIGAWKVRAGGAYGVNFVDTTRSIGFSGYADSATSDYQAGTTQLFGEIGYAATVQGIAFEPFAGLAWVHLDTGNFTETGGSAALKGASSTSDVGYSTLGVRAAVSYPMSNGMVATPRVSLAWQGAFGDLTPTERLAFADSTGGKFSIAGAPLAANAVLIDAGGDLQISPNARLGLSYLGQFTGSSADNAFRGNYTRDF